jgi:nucleotide-binding universal stress UspA family protein
MGQIIVGMDESERAAEALRWAVREGRLRDWAVTAVMAWDLLDQHYIDRIDGFDPAYDDQSAHRVLSAAVVRAVGAAQAATVALRTVCDRAAPALIDQAARADLLVVGARGLGGFRSLLLGSVSYHVVHHAACPVAVVRSPAGRAPQRPERIVVGVDGSETATQALRWALDAAHIRDVAVEVVHAWQMPFVGGPFSAAAMDLSRFEDAAADLLDRVVDAEDTSGLVVQRTVACGGAAEAILKASEDADLVVVGCRGFSNIERLLLGSVSHQVILHCSLPVVVVPTAERE